MHAHVCQCIEVGILREMFHQLCVACNTICSITIDEERINLISRKLKHPLSGSSAKQSAKYKNTEVTILIQFTGMHNGVCTFMRSYVKQFISAQIMIYNRHKLRFIYVCTDECV